MTTTYISRHTITFEEGDTEGRAFAEIGGQTIVGLIYPAGHSGTINIKDCESDVLLIDTSGNAFSVTLSANGGLVSLLKEDLSAVQKVNVVLSAAAPAGGLTVEIRARQMM